MNITGDVDQRDGKDMTEFIGKMLHWQEKFLDMPINQLKKILSGTGYNRVVFVEHSWKQLKYSMEWYERQCGLVSFEEDVILREIGLQRISGSSQSPFKRVDLIYLNRNKLEPIDEIDLSKNLAPIYFYEKINRNIAYILAVDPAEGLGLDNNAFTLINPHTDKPVAEFKSPYISPPDYVKMIIKFLDKFCPKSMIVIESNRGRELINRFLESKYRYQLWYDIDKLNAKVVETTDEYGALKRAANERRAYGFDTTRSSRPLLFAILENFMEEQKDKLLTQYLVDDVSGLIRKAPSNRVEAGPGKNDDNIMSYLLGLYVLFNATNLEDFGIIKGASAPEDIDENDPKYVKSKVQSMMASLPESMRTMFAEFFNEKNSVDDAWEYEKQVQREMNRHEPMQHGVHGAMNANEYNDQVWNDMDNSIFNSNFDNEDRYRVDINDLID